MDDRNAFDPTLYDNASARLLRECGADLKAQPEELEHWLDPGDPEGSARRLIEIHRDLASAAKGLLSPEVGDPGLAMLLPLRTLGLHRVLIQSENAGIRFECTVPDGFPNVTIRSNDGQGVVIDVRVDRPGRHSPITIPVELNDKDGVNIRMRHLSDVAVGLSSPVALASVLLKLLRWDIRGIYGKPLFLAIGVSVIRDRSDDPRYVDDPWDRVRSPESFRLGDDQTPTWMEEIASRIKRYA